MIFVARSGEDLRIIEESKTLITERRRPATAGRRITRGHQIHPLSRDVTERTTLPFNGIKINFLSY